MPGQLKTLSMKIAPPIASPIVEPISVTTGSSALRNACLVMTQNSRDALGARRAHIILVENFEQRSAHVAHDQRGLGD